jgi:hypothetical protein
LLAVDWMRNLLKEHHLAAKFGTFSAFKYERSSFTMDERYFEVVAFLVDFALIIAIHHTEMISFIKFFPVIRFFLLQLMLLKYYVFVA